MPHPSRRGAPPPPPSTVEPAHRDGIPRSRPGPGTGSFRVPERRVFDALRYAEGGPPGEVGTYLVVTRVPADGVTVSVATGCRRRRPTATRRSARPKAATALY